MNNDACFIAQFSNLLVFQFQPNQFLSFKTIFLKISALKSLYVNIEIIDKLNLTHNNHNLTQL